MQRIIFFGTPKFAEIILEKLIAEKYNVAAVFTQADKKVGRKQKLEKSPVKKVAERNKIPVFSPPTLKEKKVAEEIAKMRPDIIIIAAYGKILPGSILEIPKYGSINVHASLLPKYRGASPVQQAILNGEKETGTTLMLMNEKLDAGEIIAQEKLKISKDDNSGTLSDKLSKVGAKMLVETLPDWISGSIKAVSQNESQASFCRMVKKEDGKINWNETAEEIFRKWRAYQPWPGIHTFWRGKRLNISDIKTENHFDFGKKPGTVVEHKEKAAVQTKAGIVILEKLQLEGKKKMEIREFLRGNRNFSGSLLG